jgi:predicted ABC-type ATPase
MIEQAGQSGHHLIAGPNGAGKTTFFHSHLREAGLRFVNADNIARELELSSHTSDASA